MRARDVRDNGHGENQTRHSATSLM